MNNETDKVQPAPSQAERDITAELSAAAAAVAVTRGPISEYRSSVAEEAVSELPYLFFCYNLYPYEPAEGSEGEMALPASSTGTTIGVLSVDEEGDWWYGKNMDTGAVGWFPASYCQRIN
jgi:hypothetical protein